mgnify:CR=1 FL=1
MWGRTGFPATVFTYTFGIITAPVFGVGMCLSMKVIGSGTTAMFVLGTIVDIDESTRKILKTLLGLFDILDTAAIDCRKALSSDITDYEDAVMCETAERCEVDLIVKRNENELL